VAAPMERTAARTMARATTRLRGRMRVARLPRRRTARRRLGRRTTHRRELTALRIRVRMLTRTGGARRSRRTGRLWTRSTTRVQQPEMLGQPRARMGTNMRQRTAMPIRTPGVAGRRPVLAPMLHMAGGVVRQRRLIAARRSVGGAATRPTPAVVVGARARRVREAGGVAEAAVVGAVEVVAADLDGSKDV
jgi:hypothetical protein